MKKVYYCTLGCRVNQYETRSISEKLAEQNIFETSNPDEADIFVINTCSVTGDGARKSRQMIRRFARKKEENPDIIICGTGCFIEGELLFNKDDDFFRNIDIAVSNAEKEKIPELIENFIKTRQRTKSRITVKEIRKYQDFSVNGSKNARAFIKIEDGCNSFCSYCFVPFVRGRVRSRPYFDVFDEVKRVSENGFCEIVLTGIETGAYGEDFPEKYSLISLVEKISEIETVKRIRFGSLKPTVLTKEFLERAKNTGKVAPHFHLSLQSGSTGILSEMRRGYTREDEYKAINNIYEVFPDAGLSADIICGFPSETEEDYVLTEKLITENNFLHTHIFPFSPREGTLAAKRNDQVDEKTKKDRCERLLLSAKQSSESFAKKRIGNKYTVLCEKVSDGYMFGYTDNFIYTKSKCNKTVKVGGMYEIRLTDKKKFSVETMTVAGEMNGGK